MANQEFASQLPSVDLLAAWIERTWALGTVDAVELINLSENAMYRVDVAGNTAFVLRISQPGYQSHQALVTELWWMEQLKSLDELEVEIAEVVAGKNGEALQLFSTLRHWHCALFSFLDGQKIARRELSIADFNTLGRVAATMAQIGLDASHERPRWAPAYFLAPKYAWGNWRDSDAVEAQVRTALESDEQRVLGMLLGANFGYHLIHGDMRAANLLRRHDGGLALLDFDDAVEAPAIVDLAGALSFDEALPSLAERVAAWCRGYGEVQPLDKEQRKSLPAFLMLRRLSLLGWMTTHPLAPEAQELGVEFVHDTVGLYDKLVATVT